MATVIEKVKKAVGTVIKEDDPILYFTDEQVMRSWNKDVDPILETGNHLITTYKSITSFQVDSMENLLQLIKNPEAYYKQQYYQANEEAFSSLSKLKLDFSQMIPFPPPNFEAVTGAISKFKRYFENKRHDYFTIQNERLELTDSFYDRRNRKCFFYAKTAEEKERLKICLDVIASIKQIESILKKEKGMQGAIERKDYFLPLPYFLKIVGTNSGVDEVIPNPMFIKEGFAGTAHLGRYIPTASEKKMAIIESKPKLGEKWVYYNKRLPDGSTRTFMTPKVDYEEKYKKSGGTELLPGIFNEEGKPYGTPLSYKLPFNSNWVPSN